MGDDRMRMGASFLGAILVLAAARASAAGIDLRWNACLADSGAAARSFACNTNAGASVLAGSFVLPVDLQKVSGAEVVLDVTADAPLPAWWQLTSAGGCRPGALGISALDSGACPDWASGQASVNVAGYKQAVPWPNAARILLLNAVALDALADLTGGREYGLFKLSISNAHTTGDGACGGCRTPVCVVFTSVNLTTSANLHNTRLSSPAHGPGSNVVSWQSGWTGERDKRGCPGAATARDTTRAGIKALYR